MTTARSLLVALGVGFLCLATAALANESGPSEGATELAGRVVQSAPMGDAVLESLRLQLPPDSATEFGLVLAPRHNALWNALESELANRLEEQLTDDEIRTALARFDETPDSVWQEYDEVFLALEEDRPERPAESRRQLRIIGCVASAFGSNLDATREARAQAGQQLRIDVGLLKRNADAVAAFIETCTCVMDGIYEQFKDEMIHGEQTAATEEQRAYGRELLESGKCPSPLGPN